MELSNVTEITIKKELAKSQVVAETKLPTVSGVTKVLGVNTSLSLTVTESFNGEVRLSGAEVINIMYQTEEGAYGASATVDFTDRVECAASATTKAKVIGRVLDTDIVAVEDGGVRVASVIEITIFELVQLVLPTPELPAGVYGNEQHFKCSSLAACFSPTAAIEGDEVFKAESVLSTCGRVNITGADAALDSVIVHGEAIVDVCGASGDGTVTGTIVIPFTEEINAHGARQGDMVTARACVCKIGAVESDNGFMFAVTMQLGGEAYCRSSADVISDAFSVTSELEKECSELTLVDIKASEFVIQSCDGSITLAEGDSADSVIALCGFEFVSETTFISFGKVAVEGALSGSIVYYDADAATKKSIAALIPVKLTTNISADDGDIAESTGSVGKIAVKLKRSGEIDIKAEIMLNLVIKQNIAVSAVSSVTTGATVAAAGGAISVYIASDGESMWDCAKSLKVKPDTITRQNPALEFPLKRGDKVMIYRAAE